MAIVKSQSSSCLIASWLSQSCGAWFDGFEFVPAVETRGGMFTTWRSDQFVVTCLHKGSWSLSLEVRNLEGVRPGR